MATDRTDEVPAGRNGGSRTADAAAVGDAETLGGRSTEGMTTDPDAGPADLGGDAGRPGLGAERIDRGTAEQAYESAAADLGGDADGREDFVESLLRSYRRMEMPAEGYLKKVLLPSAGVFAVLVVVLPVTGLPAVVAAPAAIAGLFLFGLAVVYPKLWFDRRANRIDQQFHLFLTHVTALALSDTDRLDVLRKVSEEGEYGPLADELRQLVVLIDRWNYSLSEAAKRRADRTPSDLLRNFYERMAYSLGSGQSFSDFLESEQANMIDVYATRYEDKMSSVDSLKDLYTAATLASTFIIVLLMMGPLVVGVDPALPVGAFVLVFGLVQAGFVVGLDAVSPSDPLWYEPDGELTGTAIEIRRSTAAAVPLALLLLAAMAAVTAGMTPIDPSLVPAPAVVAVPATAFLLPYTAVGDEQQKVKDRDDEFPRFIRALGQIEGLKPTSTAKVLRTLREKEFGSLTAPIDGLYRRMNLHVDDRRAWEQFAADTGSFLIRKFGTMYAVGRKLGADPDKLSRIIAQNMLTVTQLREQRERKADSIMLTAYFLTGTAALSAYAGLEIVDVLVRLTASNTQLSGAAGGVTNDFAGMISAELFSTARLRPILGAFVLTSALATAAMIRVTDRGRPISGILHAVAILWACTVVAFFSRYTTAILPV